ncbi:MAG: DUF1365 domain-containing protein [Bryobacteraceae bacterium]
MNTCLYEGRVRHRRFSPAEHSFEYRVFLVYLDLDEAETAFRGRWLWSASRPALAWFRRGDHWGDPAVPLRQAIADLVESRTGDRPTGPIRLLTHFRYFGYVMNPVSFYYCFRPDGRIHCIVAEVNNTPWGETHCYVLPASASLDSQPRHRFRFPKQFHVSPFMPMDQVYDWRFTTPDETLAVHMENFENGGRIFDATMTLERRPATGPHLTRALARYPLMTAQVIAAIYWQALRLRWKRCPFFGHPGAVATVPSRKEATDAPRSG